VPALRGGRNCGHVTLLFCLIVSDFLNVFSLSEESMSPNLEVTVDKFTFKVATDRYYTREGLWALPEDDRVRVGLSDFLQQRSGDIAFAEIKPVGTVLALGDELASIETIKVTVALGTPVVGTVIEINPAMDTTPEAINQDPYGAGWLAVVSAADWETDRSRLLDAAAYFEVMKAEAEEETKAL
jgi:glycine cleavage system H protein